MYVQLEAAARELYEEAGAMCDNLRGLVQIAAQGDAGPEICHEIDSYVHAIIRKHIRLVGLSHAVDAVFQSNSLARRP